MCRIEGEADKVLAPAYAPSPGDHPQRPSRHFASNAWGHAGPFPKPLIGPKSHALPLDAGVDLIEQTALIAGPIHR